MYINKLDDIVDKYKSAYHNTIKMKILDIKTSIYIASSKEINNKDPKFKIGDIIVNCVHFCIFFVIKEIKSLCCRHMLLLILMENKFLKLFIKKY